ncbi:helix-turn-helix domain-containing protein [Atopobium sp. oral taxon 416]|nr:helix-turn-helix domain-containing protein [Atopobium sp. oral taxon 416]
MREKQSKAITLGCYYHLSLEEREDVLLSHTEGKNISKIVRKLHCDKSTIACELAANSCNQEVSDM